MNTQRKVPERKHRKLKYSLEHLSEPRNGWMSPKSSNSTGMLQLARLRFYFLFGDDVVRIGIFQCLRSDLYHRCRALVLYPRHQTTQDKAS